MGKQRIIHGVFIDPFKGTAAEIDADLGTLDKIHSLLGCDCFGIVGRPLLGRKELDVWYDDEGLLKDEASMKPSCMAVSRKTGKPIEQIVGRVFICGHTSAGEAKSLKPEECAKVLSLAQKVIYPCDGSRGKALIYAW